MHVAPAAGLCHNRRHDEKQEAAYAQAIDRQIRAECDRSGGGVLGASCTVAVVHDAKNAMG
jgi:hypothetical protein